MHLIDNWKEWHGGDFPPHIKGDTLVDIVLRDGYPMKKREANDLHWNHRGDETDILFYRVSPNITEQSKVDIRKVK